MDITDENDGREMAYNISRGFVRSFERAEMQSGMRHGDKRNEPMHFFSGRTVPDFPITGLGD